MQVEQMDTSSAMQVRKPAYKVGKGRPIYKCNDRGEDVCTYSICGDCADNVNRTFIELCKSEEKEGSPRKGFPKTKRGQEKFAKERLGCPKCNNVDGEEDCLRYFDDYRYFTAAYIQSQVAKKEEVCTACCICKSPYAELNIS